MPGGIPAVSGFYLAELLEQAGLTVNDVEIVPLSVVDGLAALTNGAVDRGHVERSADDRRAG